MKKLSQSEAIKKLREYDHCFLSPDGVKGMGGPFGVNETTKIKTNDGIVEGLSAHRLAQMICDKLGLSYPQQNGVGSQLRVCCDAIEKHLLV